MKRVSHRTVELTRRHLLLGGSATLATCLFDSSRAASQQTECAAVPFVITVQANGAWDPTFLIDPLADDERYTPFTAAQIMSAGEIRYAPSIVDEVVAPYMVGETPQDFFVKHAANLLVVNGVDNATVSHDVGPRVAFTGTTRDGMPTLSGLVAGVRGRELPLAMFVAGGYASTAGLVPLTRGGSQSLLRDLADPNRPANGRGDSIHSAAVNDLLRAATRARDARQAATVPLPRLGWALGEVMNSRSELMEARFREIAEELSRSDSGRRGGLADAASGVFALMRAGATAAAHLSTGGFDTHDNHDNGHPQSLAQLLDGLDYILDTAKTDPMIAERGLVVVVGSDFGRTSYNGGGGKDHWPITSMMVFAVGAAENVITGGRVIGGTVAEGRNGVSALPVKLQQGTVVTAQEGDSDAFSLTPTHVHHALRNAIGLCPSGELNDPLRRFAFNVFPTDPLPLKLG